MPSLVDWPECLSEDSSLSYLFHQTNKYLTHCSHKTNAAAALFCEGLFCPLQHRQRSYRPRRAGGLRMNEREWEWIVPNLFLALLIFNLAVIRIV
jgi:hypothetical protein